MNKENIKLRTLSKELRKVVQELEESIENKDSYKFLIPKLYITSYMAEILSYNFDSNNFGIDYYWFSEVYGIYRQFEGTKFELISSLYAEISELVTPLFK